MPHSKMHEIYGDEIQFFSVDKLEEMTHDELRIIDIFIINRTWANIIPAVKPVADVLKTYGAKIILDMDDYWAIEPGHAFYEEYHKKNMSAVIIEHMKIADAMITTTKYLANEIRKINKDVTILENCPSLLYDQFKPNPTPSDKIRFGYFGASQHLQDLQHVEIGFERLAHDKSLNGKYTLYCAGWHEKHAIGLQYEQIFSGKGENDNYGRIAGADIYSYVGGYNFVDVALAPLKVNKFNALKSELKIVEAAYMGKTIIATDIPMYADQIDHGVDGYLVKNNRPGDWYKYIRKMILDPDKTREMAANLEAKIKKRFNAEEISKRRYELYKRIKNDISK